MKKIGLFLFIVFALGVYAQGVNPDEIIDKVKEKINNVKDYSVEAVIKVDVNFLRVPETRSTIFFKQPDKVKMESEGFALMPRHGLNFSPASLLKESYTAIYAKDDVIDENEVHLIKILPLSDSTEVILSNLWVDKKKFIVYKIETTTKKTGTVTIELAYGDKAEYALPSELKISFKVEQMNLPPGMSNEFEAEQETQKRESMTGTVTVEYSNYKVNIGLEDEFFEDTEKKK